MITPNIEELIARLLSHGNIGEHVIDEAVDAMQSQAERITELEAESLNSDVRLATVIEQREKLRAQLAEIAATEPSMIYHGRCVIDCGDSGHQDVTMLKMIARETKLFTHPMPAQDVTELMEALEKLARLGNGDQYGNSDGNMIARAALSKYKGVK